ncbi:MinD/ParA family protein [Bacillus sp. 03113]|uniref:MinD/ParA family protein n=1 Tax=Bacillus sp. 03113 TaxID=2578211 RepID=UPI0011432D3C|nr:MinD/ParA family protein [Bacillus sp. 03113]
MKDQAERLRQQFQRMEKQKKQKVVAVLSGKGGVGKSNFSLNFSISISQKGHSILLFDMDIGMGNIDVLMGCKAQYTITDFFENNISLTDIITEGPKGIHYIAGGSGLLHLISINEEAFEKFTNELLQIIDEYDYIILDMGAGINHESIKFILSVDEIIMITNPEPTSLTDAYAAMKFIHLKNAHIPFYLVVNQIVSDREGLDTYIRINRVLHHFLGRECLSLGMVPNDRAVQLAVRMQVPFILLNDKSPASKALHSMTDRYCNRPVNQSSKHSFLTRLINFVQK